MKSFESKKLKGAQDIDPQKFVDSFKHSIPFIENVSNEDLLLLRENENESFIVYRDAVYNALKSANGISEPDQLVEIFDDLIRPEVNKLDLVIKNNKKHFEGKAGRETIAGAFLIVFGLFSGVLPPNLGHLIGAVGGCQFLTSILNNMADAKEQPPEILNNKYYFLWKVRELGR